MGVFPDLGWGVLWTVKEYGWLKGHLEKTLEFAKKGIDWELMTRQILKALTLIKTFFEKYFV